MYTMVPFRRHHEVAAPMFDHMLDDRFFRSFFNMDDMVGTAGFRVDVKEAAGAYRLEAELPGVKQENISLSVDQDVLTIAADINTEKQEQRENYLYSERRSGHVARSFSLEGIDQDGITASYRDGVLTVVLPKEKPEAPKSARRIEIASEASSAETAPVRSETAQPAQQD